jgi:N-acetylglucosamine kinase-like BadF-type ATPase
MVLVVGVDAGGTASRAVVTTLDGVIVGRGEAGPGNPISAGADAAATAVGTAVREALSGQDANAVAAGVLGIAGTSAFVDPAVAAAFARAWATAGPGCPLTVVGDVLSAFAAGTEVSSGAVLIAGTGAIAALIEDGRIVRTADGLGWLLGDEGSGRWIGLRAVRAAARRWDTPLAALVAAHAGVTDADALVRWASALPLGAIAALAPPVCALARDGDPGAGSIIAAAVGHLTATLAELGPPSGPVVLAGGLLAADTPVRDGVLAALGGRAVGTAADPAIGAARLAVSCCLRATNEPGTLSLRVGNATQM